MTRSHFHPLPPQSTKLGRCWSCHRKTTVTNHLCKACQRIQDAQEQAFQYADKVSALANPGVEFWDVSSALTRLIMTAKETSPEILQAVWDQAEYLDHVTYPAVCEIARAEVRAMGLEVVVF